MINILRPVDWVGEKPSIGVDILLQLLYIESCYGLFIIHDIFENNFIC